MVNPKMMAVVVAGAVLAGPSIASAQRFGRERPPRDGVCFYEHADYNGDYFCVAGGRDLESMPEGMNDRISSIRIFGRARVTVFKDNNFRGSSTRFDGDVRNLKKEGWNDRISSLHVESSRWGGWRRNPDRIIRRAYQDILDREPDRAGLRLYRSRMIDDEWTEAQVRDALRNSPEYREKSRMTRAKAMEIVRQAYLAVLKREPDPGSRGYVDKVLTKKWTQQDVERELRKSPEYRKKRQ
jgi:hypothetical protein